VLVVIAKMRTLFTFRMYFLLVVIFIRPSMCTRCWFSIDIANIVILDVYFMLLNVIFIRPFVTGLLEFVQLKKLRITVLLCKF